MFNLPLRSTNLAGHPAVIQSRSQDIQVSLQYTVSRRSVGSHCNPGGVTPPLGINDRGVTHPSYTATRMATQRFVLVWLNGGIVLCF